MVFWHFLFWISLCLMAYSYVLYPLLLSLLYAIKIKNESTIEEQSYPFVSVLMAAHNEEKVILQKIQSLQKLNYPKDKIEILIGSDNSSDRTNDIIMACAKIDARIRLFAFNSRNGKINIINQLVDHAKGDLLLLTDANVMLQTDCLLHLSQPFSNPKIGLVDSQMTHVVASDSGISGGEKKYISREVNTKFHEGKVLGTMMGPFGGCFLIRKSLFVKVPSNFLVDDFFLNMVVLEQGFQCVNEPKAIVIEDVSTKFSEEFRRKIRIGSGNFQNLFHFWRLAIFPSKIAFSFISHKIIRWFGFFFLVGIMVSSIKLLSVAPIYFYSVWLELFLIVLTILDYVMLLLVPKSSSPVRFLTHFSGMNLALFIGLLRYVKGIKSSVWEPTQRFQ